MWAWWVILGMVAGPAFAQTAAPLAPYAPPPSAAPLAPLPADPGAADDQPTGEVRARSDAASNNSAADTRSNIAPALPEPGAAADTTEGYLRAAQAELQAGHTGAAQEALERAESRALSRDVAPSLAGTAIAGPVITQIGAARQALSVGNTQAALQAIAGALGG